MKNLNKKLSFTFFFCILLTSASYSQNIEALAKKAENHFANKEYNEAISIWMEILDRDPENDRVQKRIENVFEIKQKKDLTLEKSKLDFKISRYKLRDDSTLKDGITRGKSAMSNFIAAYRLDPNDTDMKNMIDEMKILEDEINTAEDKERVAYALRERAKNYKLKALAEMSSENPKYDVALGFWEKVLEIFPRDSEAIEGVRKCKIAIENIIKFENIRKFMNSGDRLLAEKQYQPARLEYGQVLILDPKNRDAKIKIEQIDDALISIRNLEQRRQQAENYYQSALKNMAKDQFDDAKDDFENALALIDNYRDSMERLSSIGRFREEYQKRKEGERRDEINRQFQTGIISFVQGKYSDAISAFEKTLTLDSANQLAIDYLSKARQAQLNIEGEIVERDSQYFDIIESLSASGIKLYENGNYTESLIRWERVLGLFPKNLVAREYSLRCNLKLNPGLFKVLASEAIKQGKLHLDKKEFEQAFKNFEIIRSVSPDYPDIDKLIAQTKTGIQRKDTALAPIERADVERRYAQGIALYQRGGKENFEKARAEFAFIIQKDPNNVQALIALNRVDSQLRGGQPILEAQKKNLTPDQDRLVKKHYYLGISYYSNNEYNNAINEWRKVLAIDPTHVQSKNNIRKCLALMGR